MTGRIKVVMLPVESEIEKCREESNWARVIELAEQLRKKSPAYEHLAHFLIGEARLESHLEEWTPIEANVNRAKLNLMEARRNFMIASSEKGKKAGVALDAHLLLAKLCYACGHYTESLNNLTSAELQTLSEKKMPLRGLKIVADSFAVKGLCLQKETCGVSKFKKDEQEEMLRCLKLGCDLGLLYMQELDKQHLLSVTNTGAHTPTLPSAHKNTGFLLEQVLKETPLILMQLGQHRAALERYRMTLCAIESQGIGTIRLNLFCQLAEFLLQGFMYETHKVPDKDSVWKPKLYSVQSQFLPQNEYEEILLALLVAEAMAVRNAVLSQSPEFKDAKISAYQQASTVYDLLTIATVRWGQIPLLQESLEHAMKFSFEEVHLWRQHALSLLSVGQYEHALAVLKQVVRLDPKSAVNCLLAARACYEHLNQPVEGTKFSEQAKKMELGNSSGLLGRCHLYIGIGHQLQAHMTSITKKKIALNATALENFRSAVHLEPNDSLCEYHLSLQLALMDQITEALIHVQTALTLRPESSSTLHLLALLLSAQRQYEEALNVIDAALEEYPDCLNLMYLKSHLELHEKGGEQALITAKQMLEIWKNIYESQTSSDVPECDRKSDTQSVFKLYTSEMSDKDTSSLQANSVAALKVERALSEIASSLNSFNPRPGLQRPWMLLLEIWLLLAEFYLVLDQCDDVLKCIQEAVQIFPLSHHIMHMKGLLHMHKREWTDAKLCFQNAVAVNPQHVKSLQQLGLVYHHLGLQGLAETTLKEAARIDPTNHITWYNLGKVLEALGEHENASISMATAINVETTSPLLPFTSVPLCFN